MTRRHTIDRGWATDLPNPGPPELGDSVAAVGTALGTRTRLVVTQSLAGSLEVMTQLLQVEVDALDRAASRFRPDSELSVLNAAAGHRVRVGPLLAEVLTVSLRMAAATDGLVDPTVGRAVVAAGYDRTFRSMPSISGRLAPPRAPTYSWRDVQVQPESDGTWVSVPPGVQLDLGAVAKAWLAGRTAAMLAARFGGGVLVDLGGDLAVHGDPPVGGWRIGLPSRREVVTITVGGVATSAQDVRAWQTVDGPAHHIVDPRTGLPARSPWRAVTVHAATAAEANAASTAAMILGTDGGRWLAALGLSARLVPMMDGPATLVGAWPTPAGGGR